MTKPKFPGVAVVPHVPDAPNDVEVLECSVARRAELATWIITASPEELVDLENYLAGRGDLSRFRDVAEAATRWVAGEKVKFPHTETDDAVGLLAGMLEVLDQETTEGLELERACKEDLGLEIVFDAGGMRLV